MIEVLKQAVLHKLENANGCEEVEQIIDLSVEQFPKAELYGFLDKIYLCMLQNGFGKISEQHINFEKRINIHHALYYLKQLNDDHSKVGP